MNRITKAVAIVGVAGAVAVPVAFVATPAFADVDRRGACGAGVSELSVDREDGGFEVTAELDRVHAGSTWKVVMRHDGRVVADVRRTADREGELEVERWRGNTAGRDTFTMKATNTRNGTTCAHTIVVR